MIRKMIKLIVFIVIGVAVFFAIQDVLTPSHDGSENTSRIIKGYEALEDGVVDVLFLGPSTTIYGVSPMRIYEDSHIISYSLATAGQPVECSYYLLEKAYQTQAPKVVFLDAGSLYYDTSANGAWRYVLDNLPMDKVKWDFAKYYGQMDFGDGFWSAVFPIIKYHTRWKELSINDFLDVKGQLYYSMGGIINSMVNPTSWSNSDIRNTTQKLLEKESGNITFYNGTEIKEKTIEEPLYAPEVSERNLEYLEKLQDMCEKMGTELVLIHMPKRIYPPQLSSSTWTQYKSKIVKEIADDLDLTFLELEYDYDLGMDYQTDTLDSGHHLNIRGAEKVSDFLVEYLSSNYNLSQTQITEYEESLPLYQSAREIAYLQTQKDFTSYIQRLQQSISDWTILIVAKEEYTSGMSNEDYALLESMGLKLIREGNYTDSYVAVIRQGEVRYEAVSDREITYRATLDGNVVNMKSSGWNSPSLGQGSIKIGKKEYAKDTRGLNIVIWDHETEMVIDSVVFDTYREDKPATRSWRTINSYLRAYESAVCFNQ